MGYISNILVLIASRGMALAGFFLLPAVTSANDFKQYALYFAIWQFSSQLLSMQVGTTFFRCGLRSAFTHKLTLLLGSFYSLVIGALIALFTSISVTLISFSTMFIPAFFMSVIVAIFIIASEYARARINERLVFVIYMLPGLVYLGLFSFGKFYQLEISLTVLLLTESITYAVMAIVLLVKCNVKLTLPSPKLTSAFKRVYPFWRRISLPLIPNNLLWYFYFNAPVIIGYQLIANVDAYNDMALLFRFVVALSTISSMLALVFQKKIISIYEQDRERYLKIKRFFVSVFIPIFFAFSSALTLIAKPLLGLLPLADTCGVCLVAVDSIDFFILLFYLFFSIYLMSHYFVAEKNMSVISPSMFIGFVVYVMTVAIGLSLSLDFSVISLYSLCISLTITFIIRYVWLLNQNKLKDKKITC
jgi:hypothetical protein